MKHAPGDTDRNRIVIAIDGPAASGKGTLAERLADHFCLPYLETGLLYRAVGLAILSRSGDPADEAAAVQTAEALDLTDIDKVETHSEAAGNAASRGIAAPRVGDRISVLTRSLECQILQNA